MDYRAASPKPRAPSPVALGVVAAAAIAMAPAGVHAQSAPAQPLPWGGYAPPPATSPQEYAPPPGYALPPSYYGGPTVINDWDDQKPTPAGYHVRTKYRTGLIVAGAVTFGGLYVLTGITSAVLGAFNGDSSALGLVPIVGPFALVASNGGDAGLDFLLVLDGVAQVAGVAMFIAGFAAPTKTLVRNDVFASGLTLVPRPMTFGRNGAGLGLMGAF
jgi:hypothetical protein